jgi:mannose/fructose/N-acetylgalactosamine-specific phosphotransferase system component IID
MITEELLSAIVGDLLIGSAFGALAVVEFINIGLSLNAMKGIKQQLILHAIFDILASLYVFLFMIVICQEVENRYFMIIGLCIGILASIISYVAYTMIIRPKKDKEDS